MKQNLLDKEVLAMYDVRGIQSYIFRTNKVKEIVGASVLVEKIITDGFKKFVENNADKSKYLLNWKDNEKENIKADSPSAFIDNSDIKMQVLFIGGGNAYVLFRQGEICEKLNRFLAKHVLENSYSLKLAVAVTEKTDSYSEDYRNINNEMRGIKARMPETGPLGALPFMAVDSVTGYSITKKVPIENKYEFYSTEAKLKRNNFPKDIDEKIFDNMVTEKGDNSSLALCHIDGNSMGKRIMTEMQGVVKYEDAVSKMRKISEGISKIFRKTFDDMCLEMSRLSPHVKKEIKTQLYREIIVAGDDITFVCNAKLAIPAVKYFLKHIGETNIGTEEHKDCYTACGGIAFFNSHFPFSDAYQAAEACCESAKKRAKDPVNRGIDEKIGNFFDFQICTNVGAADLDSYREKHYKNAEGYFIARPYYVPTENDYHNLNKTNEKYSVENFDEWMKFFSNKSTPRNKTKELRNTIPMGEIELDKEIKFLKSRNFFKSEANSGGKEYRVWYDALEVMDFYIDDEEAQHENKN